MASPTSLDTACHVSLGATGPEQLLPAEHLGLAITLPFDGVLDVATAPRRRRQPPQVFLSGDHRELLSMIDGGFMTLQVESEDADYLHGYLLDADNFPTADFGHVEKAKIHHRSRFVVNADGKLALQI